MNFEDLIPSTGFMTDRHIRKALNDGYLIEKGTWEESLIRHASYMLRLGDTVHVSRFSDVGNKGQRAFDIIRLGTHNPSLSLSPGDTALLYSQEYLRFPYAVIGFTVARGLLFIQPMVPENTYVDPGFTGSLYIVVSNLSNQSVELKYQMPMARLYFFRLSEPVEIPYRTGAGVGVEQHLNMTPAFGISSANLSKENWNTLVETTSQIPLAGSQIIAELFKRMQRRLLVLSVAVVIWPLFLIIVNTNEWIRQNFDSIVTNILASIAAAAFTWVALRVWDFFKK